MIRAPKIVAAILLFYLAAALYEIYYEILWYFVFIPMAPIFMILVKFALEDAGIYRSTMWLGLYFALLGLIIVTASMLEIFGLTLRLH